MSASKRGSKRVKVEGKTYVWSVRETDQAKVLTVHDADSKRSFQRVFSKAGDPQHESFVITPTVVRAFIRTFPSAIRRTGTTPKKRTSTFPRKIRGR